MMQVVTHRVGTLARAHVYGGRQEVRRWGQVQRLTEWAAPHQQRLQVLAGAPDRHALLLCLCVGLWLALIV